MGCTSSKQSVVLSSKFIAHNTDKIALRNNSEGHNIRSTVQEPNSEVSGAVVCNTTEDGTAKERLSLPISSKDGKIARKEMVDILDINGQIRFGGSSTSNISMSITSGHGIIIF